MNQSEISQLIALRRNLHQYPELSGQEMETASKIIEFLKPTRPSTILEKIGGTGVAVVYDSGRPGPFIGFRCELDALPIEEANTFEHTSSKNGVSHKCGHDGHMAIVAGVGLKVTRNPVRRGKLVLIFQPAEETGSGAEAMLKDEHFKDLVPDQFYALHNVPGVATGKIISRDRIVCPASEGLVFHLKGKTSHAGQPDKGNNPAPVISAIQLKAQEIHEGSSTDPDRTKITTVFIRLGERAFGVNPGRGAIGFTLRSDNNLSLEDAKKQLVSFADGKCAETGLQLKLESADPFKAVVNTEESYQKIRKAAKDLGYQQEEMKTPFPWSEDFGRFSELTSTGFFGLGAGESTPELHHDTYDFPDELIPIGVNMFCELGKELWS